MTIATTATLARYNSNGSLDNTFSGDGKVTTPFSGSSIANAMAIQADGKIVAGGGVSDGFALARYNSNGSLDSTFSGDGKVTTPFSGVAHAMAIQKKDGRIVLAGSANVSDFALARYHAFVFNGLAVTILGTQGSDVIKGTAGPDVIDGLDGNDNISGLGGNDVIYGGAGKDTVNGGGGTDYCDGGPGTDTSTLCETPIITQSP